jgi:hypothetical protein
MSDFRLGTREILVEQLVRLVYRPLLLAALVVWFRGHNAPGGGFIAGLLAVAATASYALAFGGRAARARLPLAPGASPRWAWDERAGRRAGARRRAALPHPFQRRAASGGLRCRGPR